MVDSPSDNIQTHKVLGPNLPRGRVGGQKSLENPGNPEKLSPGRGGGVLGWATTLGRFNISANPETKNPMIPSNVSERGPGTDASEDQG